MSKIILLSEIFPPEPGGSGRWFFESYRRIDSHECVFAVNSHPAADGFDAENEELEIQRLDLHMGFRGVASAKSLLQYWQRFRTIRSLVRSRGCTQIHAARPLFEGLVAKCVSATTGVPFVCYVHGEDVSVAKTSRELSLLTRSVLRSARLLIANSEFTRTLLLRDWDIDEKRLATVHPGVDTQYFQPADWSHDVRQQLGWSDRPVVLTVGRLQARKGHDVFLQALAEVKQEIPDVLYAVVGDGQEYPKLVEQSESLGLSEHVLFHRELSDQQLLQRYQQCDLFCLPNRQIGADVEGFGMVLLEAQSCGKPVIAGMSGGTAETMKQGKTGAVVDCTQPKALAQLVVDLLQDAERRAVMGRDGRQFVCERFDWQAIADQSSELFKAVDVG